jgi:hypothetical protein
VLKGVFNESLGSIIVAAPPKFSFMSSYVMCVIQDLDPSIGAEVFFQKLRNINL